MDNLAGLLAFVRSAELGSFVAAGKGLGLSASAVGKSVAKLEAQLGVRLLQRSTRRIRMTEEGRLFHERCRRILDDLDDAQAMLSHTRETPRGRLRVSLPIVGYHFLTPLLPGFMARHPEVEFDVDFNDLIVDLIDDGVDVAIRSGELPDSRFVSRPLQPYRLVLCASPAYLDRHGTPQRVRELASHAALRFRYPNSGKLQPWPLLSPAVDAEEVYGRTVLTCNNMEALHGSVTGGLGIGCLPEFMVQASLARGELRTVLADQVGLVGRFNALWPSSRHLSPKVRVFVDYLGAQLAA